ncbi:MAG: zinc ribbon domain-containing protein [Vicinamibacterales bacterium]
MLCKHCGTEIADKAIICFRCGAGTTDPVRQPARLPQRRSPLLGFVVVAVLLLLALYLGQASRTVAEPGMYQMVAGFLVGVALFILIIRLVRRR